MAALKAQHRKDRPWHRPWGRIGIPDTVRNHSDSHAGAGFALQIELRGFRAAKPVLPRTESGVVSPIARYSGRWRQIVFGAEYCE